MRIELKMKPKEKLILPFSYNYYLQGLFYHMIKNKALAKQLHDLGYGDVRKFKLFTFSDLRGKYIINYEKSQIIFENYVYFSFSSFDQALMSSLYDFLIENKDIQLYNQELTIEGIETNEYKNKKNEIIINMLSPLVLYSSIVLNNRERITYVNPLNSKFNELFKANIKNKFEAIGKEILVNASIEPIDFNKKNEIITKYKGFIIKGYTGKFKIKGDSQILHFLYDVGVGGKNSQGFGMFNIIS